MRAQQLLDAAVQPAFDVVRRPWHRWIVHVAEQVRSRVLEQ